MVHSEAGPAGVFSLEPTSSVILLGLIDNVCAGVWVVAVEAAALRLQDILIVFLVA
jgi:hypothetical protein